ncbi:MAG: tetratricopeptide repeat protein, partial [Phycisphaerae bacterium]
MRQADSPRTVLSDRSHRGRLIAAVAGVAAIVLVIHWPVLTAQTLSFDDRETITENFLIHRLSWGNVGRVIGEILHPSTVKGYYRPLTQISLMADWAMGGRPDNLRPFHRTSLALHVANTVLVIALLYQLFRNEWVAAGLGLLFGLHPLTVEPIAWVMERKTPLAAFFSLGCLVLYLRYARQTEWKWYTASVAMYILALMSKPISVPLPLALVLLDYWPLRRLGRRALLEKLPFFILAILGGAVAYVCESRVQPLHVLRAATPAQIPLRICYLLAFYVSKIVWPTNLSSVYFLPAPLVLSNPPVLLGFVGTCLLLALVVVSLRWTPAPLVGASIAILTLAPTMGLVTYSWLCASDKYLYLPAIGLLITLAWACTGIGRAACRTWGPAKAGAVSLIVLFTLATGEAVATRRQLARWQNTEGYFRYMLALGENPGLSQVHGFLGTFLLEQGRLDEAAHEFREAIRLKPHVSDPHNNLGKVLLAQGRIPEAIDEFGRAIRLKEDFSLAHANLGLALLQSGRTEEAERHLRAAIRLEPGLAEAHDYLAALLLRQRKYFAALDAFREAVRLTPGNFRALNNLAWLLATCPVETIRNGPEAVALARRACELTGFREPILLNTLAAALAETGQFTEAVQTCARAVEAAYARQDFALAESFRAAARSANLIPV